jgi:superfamily II DNA/RNA helicase
LGQISRYPAAVSPDQKGLNRNMSTFAELGVSASVVDALAKRNIHEPFKIQNLVTADALAGKDVLAKSRTGSGKTLAFGIPLVERLDASGKQPTALVVVPTRELAVQVTEEIREIAEAKGLRVAAVFGGVSIDTQAKKAKNAHILIATPGRMMDLVRRRLITLEHIKILVLDEADRMLDMGFQPQVDRIVDQLRGRRQTMFFSATLDGTVGHLAKAYTHDPVRHEVADERPAIEDADHRFIKVGEHDKVTKLVEILEEERGLALVFVRTKRGADRLEHRLKTKGIEARALHGDMTQAARQRALDRFAAGKVDVLVATDVAARGLDLDDITHVINYDPPRDHKDYVHRVGRTARAGRSGAGVTFVSPAQLGEVSAVARQLELGDEFQAGGMTMTAPATVFSTKGRRSSMRSPRKRRF